MSPRKSGTTNPPKEFVAIRSETLGAGRDYRRFEVDVLYSSQDWSAIEAEARALELEPRDYLEKRLKRAIRPGVSVSRVEHARDRLKLYDGYSDFWAPFVKYLTYSHLTVIIAGAFIEFFLKTGNSFLLFYWLYAFSLVLALISWIGFRLQYLMHRNQHLYENEQMLGFQVVLARNSERLMWVSLGIFTISFLGRIGFGIFDALSRFNGLN